MREALVPEPRIIHALLSRLGDLNVDLSNFSVPSGDAIRKIVAWLEVAIEKSYVVIVDGASHRRCTFQ
jgi:hypothetical protein